MQVHPSIQLEIARQRRQELIARADRFRLLRRSTTERQEAAMTTTGMRTPKNWVPPKNWVRELARRIEGGVEVTLAWDERDDSLAVTVSDRRTGERFVLAAEQDNALDVFYHPYAHAAFRSAA
jgi:hypothetical protein